jgi:hypothetical protein
MIYCGFDNYIPIFKGGQMDAIFNIFSGLGNIHWEVIFQLLFVALIMLAGPAVIFVLAFRNGDL